MKDMRYNFGEKERDPQEDTRGQEKMEEVYAESIKQGYVFYTNVDLHPHDTEFSLENTVKQLEEKGFETHVEPRAFCTDGQEGTWMRAILVRKKK